MNIAIKSLEKIGQNTSIKQHNSLQEMLDNMNVKGKVFDQLNSKEIVCIHIDDDDDDS